MSTAPTFTILTRRAALFIFKLINQKEEKGRPDLLIGLSCPLKNNNITLQVWQDGAKEANQLSSSHLLLAKCSCSARAARLPFPQEHICISCVTCIRKQPWTGMYEMFF